MQIEQRLCELGVTLPDPPRPAGNYLASMLAGNLLFISGQLPIERGVLRHAGKVGSDLSEAEGQEAAKLCALNVLAQIRAAVGTLERVDGLVRVEGHVNSAPGWTNQHKVLDGASDLFALILGDQGRHARAAFGAAELPLNAAVELVVTAKVGR